ncbi:MAG: hypothetical protein Sylvanvirus28_1, partial [Sylvanvirus sp.]
ATFDWRLISDCEKWLSNNSNATVVLSLAECSANNVYSHMLCIHQYLQSSDLKWVKCTVDKLTSIFYCAAEWNNLCTE